MKVRKQNISFLKSGSGSLNSRIMLPITWVRELGLSQEEREVYICLLYTSPSPRD